MKPKGDAAETGTRRGPRIVVSLDDSWDQEYEAGDPAIDLPPVGRGNRRGWRSWNRDPAALESNRLARIQEAHPRQLATVDLNATFETKGYIAEPSFTFQLIAVPALTAEAFTKIHPCLLYRLLWLDGFAPGPPLTLVAQFRAVLASAQGQILTPRAAARASKRDRRRSSMAKHRTEQARVKRRGLRQRPLGSGQNNTKCELRVIDCRLRLLKQMLGWSDAKLGRLIIESISAWDPAPCPERIDRWVTDQNNGDGNPDPKTAEEWVRTRLRARN
jgi:hypothetical protein